MKERLLKWIDNFTRLPLAGMDISDRSIKFLKFGRRRGLNVDFFDELILPEGMISGGEITDETGLSKAIAEWRKTLGRRLGTAFVIVSLPEEKSYLRIIQLPKMKREEISNAIRWEIEANVPLPLNDVVYDYEIIEPLAERTDHFDIMITAFPRKVVESYVRVLKLSGFQPAALELESQAIVRSLIGHPKDLASKILIDMGRTRTSIILYTGGAIMYTSTIQIGGITLEENIQKILKVNPAEAEVIKKKVGLNKREQGGQVFTALIPTVSSLAAELKRTIAYYQDHAAHGHGASSNVEEIILTGGDAQLWGLDTYLASAVKIPVRRADPRESILEELATPILPIPQKELLGFSAAIGLALRGLR